MKLALVTSLLAGLVLADYPPPRYYTVDQDHFDGTNTNTWNQAYYVNDTFFKPGSGAPVFLCVGGEGPPLDGSVVVDSVHCNVAVEWLAETNALMFAVEHRYYGCHNASACPVPDTGATGALKFLSSRQALADLAAFRAYATGAYGLTTSNKWVSFGGSYPGMLAGWFRLKYPHLVHASVSSSAPVHAVLDMSCYNDVTAQAYSVNGNKIEGSTACRQAIATGHANIGKLMNTSDGRNKLVEMFHLPSSDWLESPANQLQFAGYGVAYFPSQGNDPACSEPACDINKICAIMTDDSSGDEVARLAQVKQAQGSSHLFLEHQKRLQMQVPRRPRISKGQADEVDYWGYQTCTEFGFYQTCEIGSECFYTQGLDTLETQTRMCSDSFGIPVSKVKENIAYSNTYYGSLNSAGTRILSVNGEIDPWHCLAILKPPNDDMPTLWVKGASHHAWTHPTLPSDQGSVIAARKLIKTQVAAWLEEE